MKCPTCKSEIAVHERFCSFCGENNEQYIEPKRTERVEEAYQSMNQNQNSMMNNNPNSNVNTTKKNNIALITGIIGIFFAGIILGIVTLSLAESPNCANPKAARILGIIDIIGGIVFFFLW